MKKLMTYMKLDPAVEYVLALGLATLVAVIFLSVESFHEHEVVHGYLLWNLALAWLPLVFALWLQKVLSHKLWSSWEALVASIAWLLFLPNAFYMLSDLVHLADTGQENILGVALLFVAFIYVGVILGLSSLYLVHMELLKRFSRRASATIILLLLFVCSFAVYIGRDLRWNSWDVLVNPLGLLFDVSERIIHPSQYPSILGFVVPLFLLLSSMYILALAGIRLAGRRRTP